MTSEKLESLSRNARFELIAVSAESTVVAEYVPEAVAATSYQTERELEATFIQQLVDQAYERVTITSHRVLVANLRMQLEALNDVQFTDAEWEQFFAQK